MLGNFILHILKPGIDRVKPKFPLLILLTLLAVFGKISQNRNFQ
jgi:hypothetical protein